ncbi:hypothetical protein JTB14_032270 [Gonioctena quinquepunctata]|nr:hypothetical protein JTB14_032270 [Gonioctena quinquepunctata]
MEDYCSLDIYNNSDSYMRFTKEATYEEFAVVGKLKGLHCCAKHYRSIECYCPKKHSGIIFVHSITIEVETHFELYYEI